jgi:hypothetical protein
MALNSARRAVFDTNELLENILSYLPSLELFVLQRVSKQWWGVIASSPGLQERMFMRPQIPKETWALEDYDNTNPLGSIRMYRTLVGLFGAPKFQRNDGSKTMRGMFLKPVTLNPILSLVDCHPIADSGSVLLTSDARIGVARMSAIERSCISSSDTVSICIPPGALHKNCSLRYLYFSDPPCRVADVKLMVKLQGHKPYGGRPELSPDTGFRVESDAGLTIGDILKAASESPRLNCCEFNDGYKWKDLRTELKDMITGTEQPSGWTGVYDVEDITLYIQLVRDGNDRPVVVTEEDRLAVLLQETDRTAAIEEEL